jgi:hypothetical protein
MNLKAFQMAPLLCAWLVSFSWGCGGHEWSNTETLRYEADSGVPDSVWDFIEASTPVVSPSGRPVELSALADAIEEEDFILQWGRIPRRGTETFIEGR